MGLGLAGSEGGGLPGSAVLGGGPRDGGPERGETGGGLQGAFPRARVSVAQPAMSSPASTPSRRGSRRAAPAQPRECPRTAVPRGVLREAGRAVPCQPRSAPVPPAPTPPCPFPHRSGPAVVGRASAAARVARRRTPQPTPRATRRYAALSGTGGRGAGGGRAGGADVPQGSSPCSPPWTRSPAAPLDLDVSSPLTYGTPSSRVEGTPRSGVRGTPVRQRPDLGSTRKGLQVDLHSDGVSAGPFGAWWAARGGPSPANLVPSPFLCSQPQRI